VRTPADAVAVDTPYGPARLQRVDPRGRPRSVLALGHGAGGDVTTPDLVAVRDASVAAGVAVLLITQPYRVAGRRSPAPAPQLDAAWIAVIESLKVRRPLVVGGRSSGARVACRTAARTGARGVVALAFPLHPPGRPERSRAGELVTGVPTLVVNGDRDPFGVPQPQPGVDVQIVAGATHDLKRDPGLVAAAVVDWLAAHGWARRA
jgi:predicted alpha/beta-hydrolase family hydrolase